jgi:hypothetical protein
MFHVEQWENVQGAPDASTIVLRLGGYLAFRARAFAATGSGGASAADLLEMTRANAEEALGADAAGTVLERAADPERLGERMRPVHIDGRLHAWEWLRLADGRVLKSDAVDHSEAHDLIGVQDIGWDVAGAEAEFDLDPEQTERLRVQAGADPDVLTFLRPAYLAFQLGLWTNAADAQAGWPEEAARARAQADRYARKLAALLGVDAHSTGASPQPLKGSP